MRRQWIADFSRARPCRLPASQDGSGYPVAPATASVGTYVLDDSELLDLANQVVGAGVRHLESSFHAMRRQHRVPQQKVDQLRRARPRPLQCLAVLLSQVRQSLSPEDGVTCLRLDGMEEELKPLLDLAPFPDRLKALVVLPPIVLKVPTDVEQRLGEAATLDEEQDDQESA